MTANDRPESGSSAFDELSVESARTVDEVCDYFEYQLYTQGQPRIEDLLGGFHEPERSALLRELLLLEIEVCVSGDRQPEIDVYRRRFPNHREIVEEVFDRLLFKPAPTVALEQETLPNIPNYRILRRISQGGMGLVYDALHIKLGTRVALKVMRENLVNDLEAEARFEREMKVIGTLAHPNIVVARDAGKWEGRHFLVMEYLEGLDLWALLQRLGTLTVADACEIVRRAALALECAREHNLVHRDIKPNNILLARCPSDSAGTQVKVVDFGLASLRGYQSLRDAAIPYARIVGTFVYMAPEQYWQQTSDIRSDIYSLGCTLYFLLLGQPPFGRKQYQDTQHIMEAHRDAAVPPLRVLRPDVSESLEQLVFTMLAKDPARRFQTPAEAAKRLAGFAEGHDLATLLVRGEAASPRTEPAGVVPSTEPLPERGHATPSRPGAFIDTVPVGPAPPVSVPPPRSTSRSGSSPPRREGRKPPRPSVRKTWMVGAAVLLAGSVIATALLLGGRRSPSVDLLPHLNPARDGAGGAWKFDEESLTSPDAPYARLTIPYTPPAQYRLEVEAQRISGGRLVIGLVYGQRQIPIVLGGVVRDSSKADATHVSAIPREFEFQGAPPNTCTCIVRNEGYVVAYDNQVYSSLPGQIPPRTDEKWQTADGKSLFLGTHNSVYRFRKIRITPLDH